MECWAVDLGIACANPNYTTEHFYSPAYLLIFALSMVGFGMFFYWFLFVFFKESKMVRIGRKKKTEKKVV